MKMRTFSAIRRRGQKRSRKCGSMLLEVMIAIVVLAIGMGGLIPLLASSMYTHSKSGSDTVATMLAEHVLEQISAEPANSANSLTITDCAGTAWTIATGGAAVNAGNGGSYGGNGANLSSNGYIDWTQTYASVPSNYAMKYVACGAGGRQSTYDVRWDVITMSTYSRMVAISARTAGTPVGGLRYMMPVHLRTIGGM